MESQCIYCSFYETETKNTERSVLNEPENKVTFTTYYKDGPSVTTITCIYIFYKFENKNEAKKICFFIRAYFFIKT